MNIWVFGNNINGQLELGDCKERKFPIKIPSIKCKQISAEKTHTIVTYFNDNISAFGFNKYGQLGLGDTKNRNNPTLISNIKAKDISAGSFHTVIIDLNDDVCVFGYNAYGQSRSRVCSLHLNAKEQTQYGPLQGDLGDTKNKNIPTQIPSIKAKDISAGKDYTIIIDLNNNIWLFGNNYRGQLGLGDDIDRNTKFKSQTSLYWILLYSNSRLRG
jgi:alpha-tubulin suppressor-like RCC1 family protein